MGFSQIDESKLGPETRSQNLILNEIRKDMAKLVKIFTPKNSVMDIKLLDKSSTFSDTEIPALTSDLIQISSDGDLTDVSYKILELTGRTSEEMEASESPHILGPIDKVLVTNDTAQSGKYIRVARYKLSPFLLPAIQHGTPSASVSTGRTSAYGELVEYASSALNYFEDDQPLGTTPTHYISITPAKTDYFLHMVRWQFTNTNAVTHELFLLDDAQAVDEQSESDIVWDSEAGRLRNTPYLDVNGGASSKLPSQLHCATAGRLYLLIDYSGATGDSWGYVKTYLEVLA